jgi:hypothetical protein
LRISVRARVPFTDSLTLTVEIGIDVLTVNWSPGLEPLTPAAPEASLAASTRGPR